MRNDTQSNKRIARNTILLYIRMVMMMAVSLFTSRVILKALGVEDFGLYNVVGGVVVLFTFINNAMTASTQRFINFELGRGSGNEAAKVFSAALSIHMAISVVFILLAETVGIYFLDNFIMIPPGREDAANVVFQFSVVTTAVNFMRTPYNAAIIAHERMSVYAYISIIEVTCKLAVVYLLYLFPDRLVAYSIMIAILSGIIWLAYYIYCRRNFGICRYRFEYNKERFVSIAGFSGWSLFGSAANMGADQGINVILNMFFGVGVNAAMGIANQVSTAVYQFVANFQTAFNPQIVKSYASGNRDYFISLILNTSRYSFMLLFMLVLPVMICCDGIMQVWLDDVPEHSVAFCRLMMLFSLIDALQGPLWMSAQATGRIKTYQLLMSSVILLNIPIVYGVLYATGIPETAIAVKVAVNALAAAVRIIYLKRLYGFPVMRYIKDTVSRCAAVFVLAWPLPYFIYGSMGNSNRIMAVSAGTAVSVAVTLVLVYTAGTRKEERIMIRNIINKYIRR